jgi:DNA-binding protein HU-beta
MNKQELISTLAEHADVNKRQAEAVLSSLVTIIQETVGADKEVTIPGIGKFSAEHRAPRKGRNPSTGAEIDIPAKCVPKFSAAQALKDAALTD